MSSALAKAGGEAGEHSVDEDGASIGKKAKFSSYAGSAIGEVASYGRARLM